MKDIKPETLYGKEFYSNRHIETNQMSEKILSILYSRFGLFRRVIDVGCGVGTFLATAKGFGSEIILGIDGPWVDYDSLVIPAREFLSVDLNSFPSIDEKYDLAISLEVAEHLNPAVATTFISRLCELAPVIMFSAAIPGQGGVGHVNERYQSFWSALFKSNGFDVYDLIRPCIWNDRNVYFWYRQNILVYVKSEFINIQCRSCDVLPLDVVHPELYERFLSSHNRSFLARFVGYCRRAFEKLEV
jgi:SAM-dependent methyltransferase